MRVLYINIYISLKTVPVILVGAYLHVHFSVLIVFSFRIDAAVFWFRSESAKIIVDRS